MILKNNNVIEYEILFEYFLVGQKKCFYDISIKILIKPLVSHLRSKIQKQVRMRDLMVYTEITRQRQQYLTPPASELRTSFLRAALWVDLIYRIILSNLFKKIFPTHSLSTFWTLFSVIFNNLENFKKLIEKFIKIFYIAGVLNDFSRFHWLYSRVVNGCRSLSEVLEG